MIDSSRLGGGSIRLRAGTLRAGLAGCGAAGVAAPAHADDSLVGVLTSSAGMIAILLIISPFAVLALWQWWRARSMAVHADEILNASMQLIHSQRDRLDSDGEADALAIFEKGARRGNPAAMRNLALSHQQLRHIRKEDLDHSTLRANAEAAAKPTVLEWYAKAAAKGDADALVNLAQLRAADGDAKSALKLYWKAARKRDVRGMKALAAMYESGEGVKKSEAKARKWSERAEAASRSAAV